MFEHLIDPDVTPVYDAAPDVLASAQIASTDFLTAPIDGAPLHTYPNASPSERSLAQQAFTATITGSPDANQAILNLKTPAAVRHHVAMLSAYDWDFVEEAKKLRGFVVSKLLDEVNHPDARIRLRALQLVGTLTEVASFTERSEVVHKDHTADELVTRLRSKLAGLLPKTVEVETIEIKQE